MLAMPMTLMLAIPMTPLLFVFPTGSVFSENGSDEDSSAGYVWALHTLAQHYAETGDSVKALSTIEEVLLLIIIKKRKKETMQRQHYHYYTCRLLDTRPSTIPLPSQSCTAAKATSCSRLAQRSWQPSFQSLPGQWILPIDI